ncbi:MAG: HlyD family efflux transporter periplasmic adaptor subunit [Planctomycetaceae bacterium]|jgi:HlyD family secretion protein|nr:HlyD family efflux transporter periplasmic adaptor subunit [Planctomycetaceae bacterium]
MNRLSKSKTMSAAKTGPGRRGNAIVVTLAVLAILIAVGTYFLGPGLLEQINTGGEPSDTKAMTHKVARENLVVTVTDDGELQSASNVDVKCEISGGSTILWIIDDGTVVEANQKIVELDSSGIEEQLAAQTGVYEKALAAQIKATEDAAAAEIAVKEYVEGTFLKDLQEVESLITIAQENMRSAQNVLDHTQRMSRKGFATPLQVEADEFAVKRARLDLEFAETSKKVLEKFTREKTTRGLEATRDAAQALARSELAAVELEKAKLDKLQKQLEKCVILAPKAGMVVYYAERSRYGSSSSQIEEGAPVRERQTIIQLPDLTQMQAKVPVHESKVEQVHAGQRVYLKVLDREFQGVVTSIANQPEAKSFFSAKVKEYPADVRVEGDCEGLRPGMTAEVEILIANLENVLTIPVSSVVVKGGQFFGYVKSPDGPQKRQLLLGLSNDKFVEVKDGVSEGEEILMNPRSVMSDQLNDEEDKEQDDTADQVSSRFGESSSTPAPAASGGKPSGGQPGTDRPSSGTRKFSDFDKNGDGKISADEAPSPRMIEAADKDGDGAISEAEFKSRPPRPSSAGEGNGGGAGGRPESGAR